jgi:hypothetical protein
MLDPKTWLTGDKGVVKAGEIFRIHNARVDGTVTVNGQERTQVKLLISTEDNPEQQTVYATNVGIVNAIQRVDDTDRRAMRDGGMMVKLGTRDTGKGNPAFILIPPDAPTVQENTPTASDDDIPF